MATLRDKVACYVREEGGRMRRETVNKVRECKKKKERFIYKEDKEKDKTDRERENY